MTLYEGPKKTTKHVKELLSRYLYRLEKKMAEEPHTVIEAWGKVVDPSFRGMTRAERFDEGILYVRVKNSVVMSMLCGPVQKKQLLAKMQQVSSQSGIKDILFSIG